MAPADAAALLHLMSHDERADLVNRLDEEQVDRILPHLAQAEREDIRRLASYEPGTAGAVMTTDYVTLPPHLTVREALERLRHEAPDRETIYYSYVVDPQRRLIGFVSLKKLILARPLARIEDIMQRDVIFARVDEDQEGVARQIAKYDLIAIPVVDANDMLVGIITHDDAMDILRQEQTEDILAFGGVSKDAEADDESYWQGRIDEAVRRRIGWLLLLFVAGTITRYVIHSFNWVDTRFPEIEFDAFIPLLIGTGGNAGSQTVGTIIRGLALGEIQRGDTLRVVAREMLTGLLLGALARHARLRLRLAAPRPLADLRRRHRPGDPGHLRLGQRRRGARPPARPPVQHRPRPRLGPADQHAGRRHRPVHLLLGRHRPADQAAPS